MLLKKHKMTGEIDYPGKGIITDEEVWKLVRKHSRFVDRLNNRKVVEMAIAAQLILCGIYESEGWYAEQSDWKFYGKKGFYSYVIDNEKVNKRVEKKTYKRKP